MSQKIIENCPKNEQMPEKILDLKTSEKKIRIVGKCQGDGKNFRMQKKHP